MPTSRSSPELVKTLQICLRYGTQSAAQIAHEKEARDSRYCETHQRPRLSQRGACTMTGSLTEAAPRKQSWWPRFGHFGQSPQGRPGTAIGRVESGQGADPKLARCPPGRGRRTWSRQPGRFASTPKCYAVAGRPGQGLQVGPVRRGVGALSASRNFIFLRQRRRIDRPSVQVPMAVGQLAKIDRPPR
jgi:hypothetical protein